MPSRQESLLCIQIYSDKNLLPSTEAVTKVIPAICQRCVDLDLPVRSLAFATLDALFRRARNELDLEPSKLEVPACLPEQRVSEPPTTVLRTEQFFDTQEGEEEIFES